MQLPSQPLNPLKNVSLSADESKMLAWLRSASWEAQPATREPIPYKAKVPEFYGGVRLYRVQTGPANAGSQSPLELFLKKLQYQGVIAKHEAYPLAGHGTARFLSLTKAELDNLGVGGEDEEE